MKKLVALLIAVTSCLGVYAQTEKGRFAASGKTEMNALFAKSELVSDSTSQSSQRSKAVNINFGFAYFVADNLALGISATYHYNRVDADNSIGYLQSYAAGVMPTVTYFVPLKGTIKPNLSAGAGYVWYFTKSLDAEGLSLAVAPGLSYFTNQNISLDIGVQYSHNFLKDNSYHSATKFEQQTIGILAGLSIYF